MMVAMQGEQLNRVEANLDTINSEVLVENPNVDSDDQFD